MHLWLAPRRLIPLVAVTVLSFGSFGPLAPPAHAITSDQLLETLIPRVQPKKIKKPTTARPKPKGAPANAAVAPPAPVGSAAAPKPRPRPEQAADVPTPEAKPATEPLAVAVAPPVADIAPPAPKDPVPTPIETRIGTLAPRLTMEQLAFAPPVEGSSLLPEPARRLDPAQSPVGIVIPPKGLLPPPPGIDHLPDDEEFEVEGDAPPTPRTKPSIVLAAIVPPRSPLVPETLSACKTGLAALKISAEPKPAVQQGLCGAPDPFGVSALQDERVKLQPAATINCEMASTLSLWVGEDVQTASVAAYGSRVTGLRVLDSYSCRGRNQIVGAQLSEHAFMNAIDIGAFQIDGRWVTVEKNAEHTEKDTDFIQTVRKDACSRFMTVLGPGSDGYHENHLHLDMRHRGKHGDSRYCH